MMPYLLVALIIGFETAAIAFLKRYSDLHRLRFFYEGMLLYLVVCVLLTYSFYYEGFIALNVLWSAFSVIAVATVGVLKFHEHINKMEALGMLMTIGGVIILRI